MIGIEVQLCEKELRPKEYSAHYMRNLQRYGKTVADFYTFPVVVTPVRHFRMDP